MNETTRFDIYDTDYSDFLAVSLLVTYEDQ